MGNGAVLCGPYNPCSHTGTLVQLEFWTGQEVGERAGVAGGEGDLHALRRQRQVWLGSGRRPL